MSEKDLKKNASLKAEVLDEEINKSQEKYNLNDDRRVKGLTPGALVRKRFFRNKVAVVGLVILVFMFLFSFVGGIISPYDQDQFFYKDEDQKKDIAGVTFNNELRVQVRDASLFPALAQAQVSIAILNNESSVTVDRSVFAIEKHSDDFYSIESNGVIVGYMYKDMLNSPSGVDTFTFDMKYQALRAYASQETSFSLDGNTYNILENGDIVLGSESIGYISRYIVNPIMPDLVLTRDMKEAIVDAVIAGETSIDFDLLPQEGEEEGTKVEYFIEYNAQKSVWTIKEDKLTHKYDTYSWPSKEHLLGTDKYGMDMLTRLMYGGRVSLLIGFIVIIIETTLGVIMGGIAGFFGGWVDNLIMRLVDVFYCLPSMPVIIIIGAAMDAQSVDPTVRMIYLMLILGFLGWAGIARLVRGQILSLREQEYMTAAEATGIKTSSRIFKHLVPNVIPQLIVNASMGLGSVIITEATLSFLGLGVKFPFASWGNIINDVNNTYVLTTYWFIWIPAGVLLLLTILAFNLVGDGLRDAFDPRMKR